MNEELLQEAYNKLGFEEGDISYDQFKQEMSSPELQEEVYNRLGFKEAGIDLDQFRTELGVIEQTQSSRSQSREQGVRPNQAAVEESQETEIDLDAVNLPVVGGGLVNLGFAKGTFAEDFAQDLLRAAGRGYEQGASTNETLEVLAKGANATDEDLSDLITRVQAQEKFGASDEFRNFQEAEGTSASWRAFWKAPLTITAELMVESSMAMARSGGAGIAAAGATGPAAVVATPLAMGATSMALESSGKMVEGMQEYLQENGGLEFNKENLRKVLEDPEAWAEIRNKAIGKGAVVGLVDGATAGLVSKIGGSGMVSQMAKAAKKGKSITPRVAQMRTTIAQTGAEMAAGGAGELASQAAIGEELDWKSGVAEIIGEGPGAVQSITSSYIVNKARMGKLTEDEMVSAVIQNDKEMFDATVDVSQQMGQISADQAQLLKDEFTELNGINESIPDNKKNRKEIIQKIRERKALDSEIQAKKAEPVDEAFQEDRDAEIQILEDERDSVNEEIQELGEETDDVSETSPPDAEEAISPEENVDETTPEQVEQETPQSVTDRLNFIEDEGVLNREVQMNVTNADTGGVESVTMSARQAQENIRMEFDKLSKLKDCL